RRRPARASAAALRHAAIPQLGIGGHPATPTATPARIVGPHRLFVAACGVVDAAPLRVSGGAPGGCRFQLRHGTDCVDGGARAHNNDDDGDGGITRVPVSWDNGHGRVDAGTAAAAADSFSAADVVWDLRRPLSPAAAAAAGERRGWGRCGELRGLRADDDGEQQCRRRSYDHRSVVVDSDVGVPSGIPAAGQQRQRDRGGFFLARQAGGGGHCRGDGSGRAYDPAQLVNTAGSAPNVSSSSGAARAVSQDHPAAVYLPSRLLIIIAAADAADAAATSIFLTLGGSLLGDGNANGSGSSSSSSSSSSSGFGTHDDHISNSARSDVAGGGVGGTRRAAADADHGQPLYAPAALVVGGGGSGGARSGGGGGLRRYRRRSRRLARRDAGDLPSCPAALCRRFWVCSSPRPAGRPRLRGATTDAGCGRYQRKRRAATERS
ncbi:unnamed protein product, partial [Scytosiphon promiscuus]